MDQESTAVPYPACGVVLRMTSVDGTGEDRSGQGEKGRTWSEVGWSPTLRSKHRLQSHLISVLNQLERGYTDIIIDHLGESKVRDFT